MPEAEGVPGPLFPPCSLDVTPPARRALGGRLSPGAALAAWEFIDGPLRERPRVVGKPLGAPFEGLWSARRGEYRVKYRVDEERRTVIVVDVEHRRDAYRS